VFGPQDVEVDTVQGVVDAGVDGVTLGGVAVAVKAERSGRERRRLGSCGHVFESFQFETGLHGVKACAPLSLAEQPSRTPRAHG
jgi:hypothetical protein